jgi:hypothetical protein
MAAGKPVLYHVHSRVVDRRFVLGTEEKEKFRTFDADALMRMQENFTGCRAHEPLGLPFLNPSSPKTNNTLNPSHGSITKNH